MSIDRQYGVHELPGTEEPAPQIKRETVSAGFELQVRGYVSAIWAKIAELEGKIEDFAGWRTAIALALKDATGIDPRNSTSPNPSREKPSREKPWELEGVSRRTYFRRKQKEAAP
jgi:hypothetical protein